MDIESKIWKHTTSSGQTYIVTARRDWIDEAFVSSAFASDQVNWASAISPPATKMMLDNSITLCLYLCNSSASDASSSSSAAEPSRADLIQIGMARLVTDQVTLVYLADVIVTPEYQGKGLGEFLLDCVKKEVEEMKTHGAWRRMILIASKGSRQEKWYKRALDMITSEDLAELHFMTTKRPNDMKRQV